MSAFTDTLVGIVNRLIGRASGQPRFSGIGERVREEANLHRHMPSRLRELIEQYPDRPEPLATRGEEELADGQLETALATAAELRARFPRQIIGYHIGCLALRRLKRHAEAEALARQAIRRLPRAQGGYEALAFCATDQEDWNASGQRWLDAARRFPQALWIQCMAPVALARQGRAEAAEAGIAAVQRNWPGEFWPVYFAAEIAEIREDWELAVRRWIALSRRFPGRIEPYQRGAKALRMVGAPDQAQALAEQGLYIFPSSAALKAEQDAAAAARPP